MLAVKPCKKFRPPIGPISPWANRPATGTSPKISCTARASWCGLGKSRVPRPLHVNSSAPAGPWVVCDWAAEQFSQVFVGGPGIAHMELHGLARPDKVANPDRARLPIGADHVADQKIAARELVAIFADRAAEVQAVLDHFFLVGAECAECLVQLLEGRLAPQLGNDVLLGLGNDHRPADRPATLRYDRARRSGPWSSTATAPERSTCRPISNRFSPGPEPPLAMPPTAGTCGRSSFSRLSNTSAGKLNGSPITSSVAPGGQSPRSRSGQPMNVPPSAGRNSKCIGTSSTSGSRAAHNTIAGAPSTSTPVPTIASPVEPMTHSVRSASQILPASRAACGT